MRLSHGFGYEIMRRDFIFAVKLFSELVNKKFDIVHDDFHDDMIISYIFRNCDL